MNVTGWHIEMEFQEDGSHTRAAALLRLPDGTEMRAHGHAKRYPTDPDQPRIGEEVAGARALSDMAHRLLEKASAEIEETTHRPVQMLS